MAEQLIEGSGMFWVAVPKDNGSEKQEPDNKQSSIAVEDILGELPEKGKKLFSTLAKALQTKFPGVTVETVEKEAREYPKRIRCTAKQCQRV
ncbi:MAG: hypothetical protein HY912_07635 [Desulfomonile tiedjei]|uniref:Uncharacterized protein n=1 Tax=Desulfomonile tiedjei TaxID=2358 RepID=A0A9D6V0N0_9BACT|nr:hypothetical protein [Desulfomonile tiedjei]